MQKRNSPREQVIPMDDSRFPHTDFHGAFTPGVVFIGQGREMTIDTAKWGVLNIPSGKIIVSDATNPARVKPFTQKVPPGKYPVTLSWNSSATCALLVRFSKRKVASWKPALRVGEKAREFDENHPPCFGVDSGVAGIFDATAVRKIAADPDWYRGRFDQAYQAGGKTLELDAASGAGVVWCHSGYGDGGYPSYWGFDRSNNVACLVLDFRVLVEAVYEDHKVTELHEKVGADWVDPWFAEVGCRDVRLRWHSKKRKELQFEYRSDRDALEVQFFDGKGKQIHAGVSGGSSNGVYYSRKVFDVAKDKKARLLIRCFKGVRSLPRKEQSTRQPELKRHR